MKNTTSTGKAIVRVNVKFGKGDVRTVRFVAGPKRVTITSRGLPKITLTSQAGGFLAYADVVRRKREHHVVAIGNTPEQCYKRIVRGAWQ